MSRSVTIRPVQTADLVAVRAALIETWHATYDTIYGPDKVRDITTRWHSFAALAAQIDRPDSAFLLAAQNGHVLASSYAVIEEGGIAHLSRLYVHPTAQGQAVGQQLMAATFAALPNVATHRLEVEPRNAQAIAFYCRAGFVETGRTGDCGGDSGMAALVFTRTPA